MDIGQDVVEIFVLGGGGGGGEGNGDSRTEIHTKNRTENLLETISEHVCVPFQTHPVLNFVLIYVPSM